MPEVTDNHDGGLVTRLMYADGQSACRRGSTERDAHRAIIRSEAGNGDQPHNGIELVAVSGANIHDLGSVNPNLIIQLTTQIHKRGRGQESPNLISWESSFARARSVAS